MTVSLSPCVRPSTGQQEPLRRPSCSRRPQLTCEVVPPLVGIQSDYRHHPRRPMYPLGRGSGTGVRGVLTRRVTKRPGRRVVKERVKWDRERAEGQGFCVVGVAVGYRKWERQRRRTLRKGGLWTSLGREGKKLKTSLLWNSLSEKDLWVYFIVGVEVVRWKEEGWNTTKRERLCSG